MYTKNRCTDSAIRAISDIFLDPTNHSHEQLTAALGQEIADDLFRRLYKSGRESYRQIIPLSKTADGSTSKYLFELCDRRRIETVCIKRRTGISICLSTQVGCSVRCVFCKSGEKGLLRNLTASEIVQQMLFVDENVNRIVFMGIGEPLNNYDQVMKAIRIFRDRRGIDFPTEGITISTVGPVDMLKRLKEEHVKIQLVLSLHATDQRTRDAIIPGMARYSINETIAEAVSYARRHNRKVTIAYLLLPGLNDRDVDSARLVRWFAHSPVRINLLRYNGVDTELFNASARGRLLDFKERLESGNIEVSLRESLGSSIEAACGQLLPA